MAGIGFGRNPGPLQRLAQQWNHAVGMQPLLAQIPPAIDAAKNRPAHQGRVGLALVADGTLERGAIVIETGRGNLDASLEAQLGEIGRGLADRLPEK